MSPISSLAGVVVGAGMVAVAIHQVSRTLAIGMAPGAILTAFAWELVVIAGVYILGWGVFRIVEAAQGDSGRATPPESQVGVPSAGSRVRR